MDIFINRSFWIFFILSFINVLLSTARSILTIKSSRSVAAVINAVGYTFYAVVVKQFTAQDNLVIIIVTMITNLVGVWFVSWFLEKIKKDKLWKIEVSIPSQFWETIHNNLRNVPHSYIPIGKYYLFNFYCSTQKESQKVKDIVNQYGAKYFVAESKTL